MEVSRLYVYMFKCLNDKEGFTLIEMLIAMSILVIMVGAVITLFIILYREQAMDIVRIERINIASRAIKKISPEIRKMNRGENGSYPIKLGKEHILIFYADVDNDGETERVIYYLSGTDLARILTEPTGDPVGYEAIPDPLPNPSDHPETIVARDVRNGTKPVFKYYDKDHNTGDDTSGFLEGGETEEGVNVTMIRVVEINLDINPENNYLTNPFNIKTKIHPRNLKNFK